MFCENAAVEHTSCSLSAMSSFCSLFYNILHRSPAGLVSISRIYRPRRDCQRGWNASKATVINTKNGEVFILHLLFRHNTVTKINTTHCRLLLQHMLEQRPTACGRLSPPQMPTPTVTPGTAAVLGSQAHTIQRWSHRSKQEGDSASELEPDTGDGSWLRDRSFYSYHKYGQCCKTRYTQIWQYS